jgi:peptidoglycan hydrolase-like protein with peptidoglycan-binding domain
MVFSGGLLDASDRIRRAAMNAPPMAAGERGPGVSILQAALIDVGYKLPGSTGHAGQPDGIFGMETRDAVYQFQVDQKLKKRDGIAGRDTLERLARVHLGLHPSLQPGIPPARPVLPISTRDYELGTANPVITPDRGAGPWNSNPKTAVAMAQKELIQQVIPSAYVVIGPDAAKHMVHYLGNSGRDLEIDLEGMVAAVPSAMKRFQNEVTQAQQFVELLPVGTHSIRSKAAESAYCFKQESENWYFAVGGYATWGTGQATVKTGAAGREYQLAFEYGFFDRYNWDTGKKVKIFNITVTDYFMGEFHRQGLAREYDMRGSFKRAFSWRHGQAIPQVQYLPAGGR